MYLSQVLLEMILPSKPIRPCSIASSKPAAVAPDTRVGSLVSIELELSVIGASASVDAT